jgi:2-oxoglutarate dehydrogenase E2 component (dihydrolipoamide succinyltransferase)
MTRAAQGIPHGQVVAAADLTELVGWREAHKSAFEAGERAPLTFTVLFVYALARQLTPPADVGVAVALDSGLIVPVLRQADRLSLGETARQLAELAARARARQLALEDTQGAQMTLTNVGSFGNLTAAPIIPVGQRGILGPGLVERRPLPAPDGGIRPGWRCLVSFVYDRREQNDFAADRFVTGVVDALRSVPSRSYVSS